MTHRIASALLPTLVATLLLSSCNQGSAPVAPTNESAAVPIELGTSLEGALLAGFDLDIDVATGTSELLPLRQVEAVGDTYSELGLAPAFTEMFGRNFEVIGLRHNGAGQVEVDFRITHPFTPANRPDLAIFNVKAWAVTDRSATTVGGVSTVPDLVTNSDGYGRMWQETASTLPGFTAAEVQPYILMREDLGSAPFDFQNPAGFNVLFPGMTSDATLALDLATSTQISLRMYLTADYGQSAVRATRQTPAYELPKFAGNAAWKVAVTELSNDLEAGQSSSTANYQVDIWDWKHGQSLGSDVASATLHIPGVTASPLNLSLSGTGSDPTPLTANTIATNAAGATEGDYWGVVTVTDAATSGVGLKEDLSTPISVTSYGTYQFFPVSVANTVVPPVAAFTRCYGGDMKISIGDTFDASTSTAGTNPITTYEWDWDYDGSSFTVDSTGITASHAYATAATFTVALRASDGLGGEDIETAVINVTGAATWNAPTRLTNNAIYERYQGGWSNVTHALTQTDDGVVHLVYPEMTGTFPSYTLNYYHQMYSGCVPTWQPRNLFYTTVNGSNWQWNNSLTHVGNTVHASITGPLEPSAYPEYRHAIYSGGSWTVPGRITTYVAPGQYITGGMIQARTDGTIGFVTKRVNSGTCPGIPAPLMPVSYTEYNGSTWSAMTQIGNRNIVLSSSACGSYSYSDEDMDFIATADNEWLAIWSTNEQAYDGFTNLVPTYTVGIRYNRTTGGVWGTQSYAYNNVNRNSNPVLARSPNGTIWLATGITSNTSNIAMGTWNGTTWSPLTTVRTAIGSEPYFGFGFAATGEAALTYVHNQSSPPFNVMHFNETTPIASMIGLPTGTVEAGGFARVGQQVLGLEDGRIMALWLTDKYAGGPFTGREIDTAVWQ